MIKYDIIYPSIGRWFDKVPHQYLIDDKKAIIDL